ncbi:nickel insertion protein [Adlercreutzia faecimuris]|uniref:LarC family nickel insertion protein n=1 Tax=Adlercreutzia faecimuris TaxID=2897341 RepID=A0ABS9WFS4_9ACTN|nr:nickel insertion protein [Adlercreutzia sp. JBNU-10]MCI2241714.1 LarC family nickel insertion protein [Adlercreutzia sp. JBNU-10]
MGEMLYLECASGISGDMAVAALIDAGASEQAVRAACASLPVEGFELRIGRVAKSGLDVCDFDVVLDAAHDNHDHDLAYLHGHDHSRADAPAGASHPHGHTPADSAPDGHAHPHSRPHADPVSGASDAHAHDAHPHAHPHERRGMAEIAAILEAASLTDGARERALRIFGIIAEAEAEAHGVPVAEVHFHEVGAVDSIVDIVAAAVALDDLASQGIEDVVVEELVEGRGTIRCQHGIIPVPAPAVVNIARAARLPLRLAAVEGELVTPTGAAIAAAARTRTRLPERFTVRRVGMGAGKRAYETAGILRALVIEEA